MIVARPLETRTRACERSTGDSRPLIVTASMSRTIPVSCFTATAKQKVISDICDYFKEKLNLELEIFASPAERENLRYTVLYKISDEEKYNLSMVRERSCSGDM